jgi:hypothetical protein
MAQPKPLLLPLTLLTCALVFGQSARAIDFNWTGAVDSDWLTAGNWTPAGPPSGGGGNNAFVNNGGTATISADIPQVQDHFIGRGAGGVGTVNQTAGNATNVGWTFVGTDGGTGTYNLTGVGGTLGSGSLTTGRLYVGGVRDLGGGTGTMTINTTGAITLSSDFAISTRGGNGLVTLNAGNIVAGSWAILGETHNGVGGGTGTFIQNGGTVQVGLVDTGGRLWLGSQEGTASTIRSTGNYTLNNGTLTAQEMVIGKEYDGNFTQNAGTTTFIRGTNVAQAGGSIGTVTLSGNSVFTQQTAANPEDQATWSHIGNNGTATFNLSDNALASFSSRTHIGTGGAGNGTVNQTGGIFEVRDHELVIGDTGHATYNISGGTLQTFGSRGINVGNWDNSVGNLNISGTANVSMGGNMIIGQAENNTFVASGTVTQTGGTLTVGGDINFGQSSIGAAGVLNLNGGILDVTGGNIQRGPGTSAFNMTAGILRNVGSIIGNSTDNTFTQQGGTFEVGAIPGAGGLTTVNGNYSLLATGTIKIELSQVGGIDQLAVNGTVTLAGTLDLDQLGTFTIDTPLLFLANDGLDAVIGAFSNAPNGVPFTQDGHSYTVFYNGGDGNDVIIIPEPTGLGFMALALASSGLLGRRRRKG